MAKKKSSLFRSLFGNRWGIWDWILLLIVIGYPTYLLFTQGFTFLIKDFISVTYYVILASFIVKLLISKARK